MTLHAVLGAALVIAVSLAPNTGRAAAPPERPAGEAAKGPDVRPGPAAPPLAPAKRKPRMSDRCNTPAINCILMDRQASGSSCWCVTPFGPSYGRVP